MYRTCATSVTSISRWDSKNDFSGCWDAAPWDVECGWEREEVRLWVDMAFPALVLSNWLSFVFCLQVDMRWRCGEGSGFQDLFSGGSKRISFGRRA